MISNFVISLRAAAKTISEIKRSWKRDWPIDVTGHDLSRSYTLFTPPLICCERPEAPHREREREWEGHLSEFHPLCLLVFYSFPYFIFADIWESSTGDSQSLSVAKRKANYILKCWLRKKTTVQENFFFLSYQTSHVGGISLLSVYYTARINWLQLLVDFRGVDSNENGVWHTKVLSRHSIQHVDWLKVVTISDQISALTFASFSCCGTKRLFSRRHLCAWSWLSSLFHSTFQYLRHSRGKKMNRPLFTLFIW